MIGTAFLRGVNVAGHKRFGMEALRASLRTAGMAQVSTYLQSGNVIFDFDGDAPAVIQQQLKTDFGFDAAVIVRSVDELKAIQSKCPYPPEKSCVVFLDAVPEARLVREAASEDGRGDEFSVSGKTIFVHVTRTYRDLVYTNAFFEKRLHRTATSRSWKTVCECLARCEALRS